MWLKSTHVACAALLLVLWMPRPPAGAGVFAQGVFGPIPAPLRKSLARRLNLLVEYRRGRRWDEWKQEAGSHRRSPAETAMMRLKTILSDRLKSREWRRQGTELRLRCAAMNKMTNLGMPQSYAV